MNRGRDDAGGSCAAATRESQQAATPDQVLRMLKDGNARFLRGQMLPRDLMAQVRQTASGQYPYAAVLGCADSRVPPELIFDQGIGDLFCCRVAGNYADRSMLGSLEFATHVAGVRLIVVLGHGACAAITSACDSVRLGNLTRTLSHLMPAVSSISDGGECSSADESFVEAVTRANVHLTVESIGERSAIIRTLVDAGKVRVIGAVHDVASGRVAFIK